MFDKSIILGLKTVGTYLLYQDKLAFMIGPDKTGKKLGIVRIGGHIEENETVIEALNREVKEEADIDIKILNSPRTYYILNWDDNIIYDITEQLDWKVRPFVIKGDNTHSTALFLSSTSIEPKPSSEAYGIILIDEKEIYNINNKNLRLIDFINQGGKLIKQKEIDVNLEMYAGVHLKLLYQLLNDKNELICNFIKGNVECI